MGSQDPWCRRLTAVPNFQFSEEKNPVFYDTRHLGYKNCSNKQSLFSGREKNCQGDDNLTHAVLYVVKFCGMGSFFEIKVHQVVESGSRFEIIRNLVLDSRLCFSG